MLDLFFILGSIAILASSLITALCFAVYYGAQAIVSLSR